MATTNFASLKKNRTKSLDTLNAQLDKISTKSYQDPNEGKFWKPTRDKAGNGFAIIRFLPACENEEMPFVRIWDHGFQGPTGLWYIENSLTTINQDDPVSEYNSKLWNSGIDADKDQARKQKRRLKYTSNIYVVKDPANPDNEGKVFMYSFGKKIFDKLNDLMNPTFEDEEPVNPFDLWEGANFRLKIRKFEGYPNYDKSEFDSPTPLLDDDEALEGVWKQEHSLQALVEPSNFKAYDELKTKLFRVLDLANETNEVSAASPYEAKGDDGFDISSTIASMPESAPAAAETASQVDDDDDDDLAIFKDLARN
jgi:hypothetical protein|tara:strand:- start:8853 stop:9785 length:933 start_codon:yes stop_codon:yes gene_type:complete